MIKPAFTTLIHPLGIPSATWTHLAAEHPCKANGRMSCAVVHCVVDRSIVLGFKPLTIGRSVIIGSNQLP
jgi:hypothetical protein